MRCMLLVACYDKHALCTWGKFLHRYCRPRFVESRAIIADNQSRRVTVARPKRNNSTRSKQRQLAFDVSIDRHVEMKYLDYTSVSGSVGNGATNWSLWYVPRVTRGSESYSRIGNQIYARRLQLKLFLLRNAAGAVVQRMHAGVLLTKQPEGVSAQAADLYSNPSAFNPYLTPEYKNTVVLWQKDWSLEAGANSSASVDVDLPLNFDVRYISNSGLAADCQLNCIDLVLWSDQSTNQPTVSVGSFRLLFTDN